MPLQHLNKYWGYNRFRPLQEEIIQNILTGNHTFVMLPTGGGKSICYQIPAVMLSGFCLVISPLIALMHDQVERLKSMGISATYFHSAQSKGELEVELISLRNGKYKLAYISPERLQSELFKSHLPYLDISFLAVDEAHCISQWGYDFRPAYLQISSILESKPNLKIMALTATATQAVRLDIIQKLGMEKCQSFQSTFYRPNLSYRIQHSFDKRTNILNQSLQSSGSGIVYAGTRAKVVELVNWLRQEGVHCDYYHAGIPTIERNKKQEAWIKGVFPLMICTNAFGMGIDKPDVRYVIHYNPPNSLEAYYQEAGRAGRDEKPSICLLLWDEQDLKRDNIYLAQQFPSLEQIEAVYENLGNYFQLALHSGQGHSFPFELSEFCNRFYHRPIEAHYALKQLQMLGYIALSESILTPARVKISMDSLALYDFQLRYDRFEPIIKYMLRAYGGIYDRYTTIYPNKIAQAIGSKTEKVKVLLKELDHQKVLHFVESADSPMLTFLQGRQLKIVDRERWLHNLKKSAASRIKGMHEFVQSENCRSKLICRYFNEERKEDCEKCDVCQLKRRNAFSVETLNQLSQKIEDCLSIHPLNPKSLLEQLKHSNNDEIKDVLRWLIDDGKIDMNAERQLRWKK